MFDDLPVIGGKLYVMGDGLIKYCRFCPKCVSIGQNRMWWSTPKTYGKEQAWRIWNSSWCTVSFPSNQNILILNRQGMTQQESIIIPVIPFWLQSQLAWRCPSGHTLGTRMWANTADYRKIREFHNY